MKVAILFALVAAVSAGQIYQSAPIAAGIAYGGVGIANTGSSHSNRAEDGLGNYQFAYNEQGATGGSARSESGDVYGRKTGSYALNVGDGRQRVVNYVADEFGYRAQIQTNEPGTAPLAGADTTISAPDTVGIAAATNHRAAKQIAALAAAPRQIIAAPAYAHAPVAVAAPVASYGYAHAAPLAVAHAAPVASYGYAHAAPAIVARAPVAYSTNVAHVAAAPALGGAIYGASYAHAAPALGYGYGNIGLARAPLAVAKAW